MKNWKIILSVISIVLTFIGIGLVESVLAPFYPAEARQKGATPSQYGFVLGIVHFAILLSSPVSGKYGPKIGIRLCFLIGVAVGGVSAVAFSFLEKTTDVTTFLLLSYLLRFILGVAYGMAWPSGIGVLIDLVPHYEASAQSWVQASFGFGICVGPAVGSWLYNIGGFTLPFMVNGFYMMGTAIILIFTLYHPSNQVNELPLVSLSSE